MPLSSMIAGALKPLGEAGSLFKNPAETSLNSLNTCVGGLNVLKQKMQLTNPSFDPSQYFSQITESVGNLTSKMTEKISNIGSELPLSAAASVQQYSTKNVDSILSGDLSGISNSINQQFPTEGQVSNEYVNKAFKAVTESNTYVNSSISSLSSTFNNSPALTPLYQGLNNIPGVSISNGEELLKFLGNIPPNLATQVDAVLNSTIVGNSTITNSLANSFSGITQSMSGLTSSVNSAIDEGKQALDIAINEIKGASIINMIKSPNPAVSAVMAMVVNPAAIDQRALEISKAVTSKSIGMPGQEAVDVVKNNTPLTLASPPPKVTVEQMIAPNTGNPVIDKYEPSKLFEFVNKVSSAREDMNAKGKEASRYYDEELMAWKKSVDYDAKKLAAKASEENPRGASSDQEAIAAWLPVFEEWTRRRLNFINEIRPGYVKAKQYWYDLVDENSARLKFGKYPYTFQIAQGVNVPPEKQFTNLDSTK